MGEEFIAVIKLVSGEEILASVCIDESGEEPIIIAHTPVTMKMINNGMYVKIKPWMELADDDMFIFHMDKIITAVHLRKPIIPLHTSCKVLEVCSYCFHHVLCCYLENPSFCCRRVKKCWHLSFCRV